MPPTHQSLSRKTRWFRPALDLLDRRLPPGDTLLGLLVAGGLLDVPISDPSFANESVIDTVLTWSRTRNDVRFGSHPNSNATCESVVTCSGDFIVARPPVPLSAAACHSAPM